MSITDAARGQAGRGLEADGVLRSLVSGAAPAGPRATEADAASVMGIVLASLDAIERDPVVAARLTLAGVHAELVLADADAGSAAGAALSLDLTGDRLVVGDGPDPQAAVRVHLKTADLARVWLGQAELAMLIAEGDAAYEGPVRRLLRIMPILRRAIDAQHTDDSRTALEDVVRRLGPPAPAAAGPVAVPEDDVPPATLLDRAADFRQSEGVHEQEAEFEERTPGEFWSIRCHDVTKSFGSNHVLRGLNFSVPEGMITVVLGPSGTGKSVLINHLIGLSFPDEGDVVVHGESLTDMRRSRLNDMRREFGVLFQDGALFGSMSMYDNVAFPLRQHTDADEDAIRERVESRLADVGLREHMHRMPNELSGGMKKRAGFARALMLDPSIVLFDEPDSGLDPVRTGLLCELIRDTHAQYGGTYVVITHDIASARQVGQYIAVLWKGRIVQAGSAQRMLASSNPFVHQFLNRDLTGPLGME